MLRIPTQSVCSKGWGLPLIRLGTAKAQASTNKSHNLLLGTQNCNCIYATSLPMAPIVQRSVLSTIAAATYVGSHQRSKLQLPRATAPIHRLLARSPKSHDFLRPSHTRALSKRPERRHEPWVVREIRESLRVARKYDFSFWQLYLKTEWTSVRTCLRSDPGQLLKRLAELRVS